jgi:hypothetical protein
VTWRAQVYATKLSYFTLVLVIELICIGLLFCTGSFLLVVAICTIVLWSI